MKTVSSKQLAWVQRLKTLLACLAVTDGKQSQELVDLLHLGAFIGSFPLRGQIHELFPRDIVVDAEPQLHHPVDARPEGVGLVQAEA